MVAIIGLGYVGFPLAFTCAKKGFFVRGFDVDQKKIQVLKKNPELSRFLKNKSVVISSKKEILKGADIFIICVPTPLTKHKEPDISYIENAARCVKLYLKKESLVVLESSTYPGTTEEVLLPILEETGLQEGRDFYLAFSPERVDPGNPIFETHNIPKIVGGVSSTSTKAALTFYRSVIEIVYEVSSAKVAEMVKIYENTFRLINISFANEMALLCDRMKISIWEVIEAAKTKPFGFMPFYPGPGTGGHCIPVDPFYLSWKARQYNFFTRFTSLAGEINELMPHFVVTKVIYALNKAKKSLHGSKILMLGVSYKKNIADIRESPALTILEELLKKHARVDYFDPFVPEFSHEGTIHRSIRYSSSRLSHYDLVLIVTDHSGIDYTEIAKKAKLVVDTRNAIKERKYTHVYWL